MTGQQHALLLLVAVYIATAKQKSSMDSSGVMGICGERPTWPDVDSTETNKPLNKPQLEKILKTMQKTITLLIAGNYLFYILMQVV